MQAETIEPPRGDLYPEIADSNIRKRQNEILCTATRYGLPRNFAIDLYTDCCVIARHPEQATRTFGLLLRENGTALAYDASSAEQAMYWIDNDDLQCFFIYRAETRTYATEDGSLEKVYKRQFREFLANLMAQAEGGQK